MSVAMIILIIAAANAIAIPAMLLIRRRTPKGGLFHDSQRAAGALSVCGTMFAVMVGFVFLIAFQSYGHARSAAADEAVATGALFNTAEQFPNASRNSLQGALICYGRAVIFSEWPDMADDISSPLVDHWEGDIENRFELVHPRGNAASNAEQNWFQEMDARAAARHGRLSEADPFVPTAIWFLLILSGCAVVGLILFFADPLERRSSQIAMIAGVTTLVTASLLTVAFLDNAYGNHAGAISPKAMQGAVKTMERVRATNAPGAALPCNAAGRPA